MSRASGIVPCHCHDQSRHHLPLKPLPALKFYDFTDCPHPRRQRGKIRQQSWFCVNVLSNKDRRSIIAPK